MGKWFRKIWIGLLSGSAVLASCNIIDSQPRLYGPPPLDPIEDTIQQPQVSRRDSIRQRLQAVRDILEEKEFSEVYGSPEIIEEHQMEISRLKTEVDSLERELKAIEEE